MVVFPEMRAQLRTYHPIPSLQYGQNQNAKLLQDAPRIKSILKGVQEDRNEPFTWEQLLECRKRGLKTTYFSRLINFPVRNVLSENDRTTFCSSKRVLRFIQ